MKIVGIGDKFIPCEYILEGFGDFSRFDAEVSAVEWKLRDFDELQEMNLIIEQNGSDAVEPPDYIYNAVHGAEVIITQFCPVTKMLIDSCANLKYIGVLRSGVENVNVAHATEKGIRVFNTPGRNAEAVSDFAVGMMICEARNIARGHCGLKNGEWIRNYPNSETIPDLPGRSVGIVGFGEIGRKVAKKLSGFDMKLVAFDPFFKDMQLAEELKVTLTDLDTLMVQSDFITVHARLTKENEHLIGARELSLMKKSAYIINTSRSGLIDEGALYKALRDHKIAGAALDVFDKEPPEVDYPLVALPNVTITPHMAGGSKDAFFNTPKKLAADMQKAFMGDESQCKFLLNAR